MPCRITPPILPNGLGWRDRVLAVRAGLERFPLAILQFMFRVSIAAVFWNSGLTKIASWQSTVVLFRDEYKVPLLPPEVAAVLGASVELTCPLLLVLGFDWVEHLGSAPFLLLILTRGPGPIALHWWVLPLLQGRRWAMTADAVLDVPLREEDAQ